MDDDRGGTSAQGESPGQRHLLLFPQLSHEVSEGPDLHLLSFNECLNSNKDTMSSFISILEIISLFSLSCLSTHTHSHTALLRIR